MKFGQKPHKVVRVILLTFFLSFIEPVASQGFFIEGTSATKVAPRISVTRTTTSLQIKLPTSTKGNTYIVELLDSTGKVISKTSKLAPGKISTLKLAAKIKVASIRYTLVNSKNIVIQKTLIIAALLPTLNKPATLVPIIKISPSPTSVATPSPSASTAPSSTPSVSPTTTPSPTPSPSASTAPSSTPSVSPTTTPSPTPSPSTTATSPPVSGGGGASSPTAQSVTFTQPRNMALGDYSNQLLTVSASSGLPVSLITNDPTTCEIKLGLGYYLVALKVGTCTVTASQSGNASYSAATPISVSISITSGIPANITIGSTDIHPGGTTRIMASGYKPGSQLVIQVHSTPIDLETLTVSETGTIDTEVQIPSALDTGIHALVLNGVNDSNTAVSQNIPINVINTSGKTVNFTGKVTTASGVGVPELFISAATLDGSGTAMGRSDSNGNFNVAIPTGVDQIKIYWMEWSDSQAYSRTLHIPDAWTYTVDAYDVTTDLNWNLQLPDTVTVGVAVADHAIAGYVSMQSTPSGTDYVPEPLSSSFEIVPGVSGELRQGTVTGRYTDVGNPATFDIFPVSNFASIFVTTSLYSGNGYGFMPGIANQDLRSAKTLTIPYNFVPLTLNVDSGGRTSNAGPISILANDSSFSSNGKSQSGTYLVPANVPFRFTMFGAASRSGGAIGTPNGPFPPSWTLKSDTITVTSATTISLVLPPTIDINVNVTNAVNSGTGQFTVSDDSNKPISVAYTGGTAILTNGPAESQQTGGDFYLFDTSSNLETVTVTTRGEVVIATTPPINTSSQVITKLQLSGIPATTTQYVSTDLSVSGKFYTWVRLADGTHVPFGWVVQNSTSGQSSFGEIDSTGAGQGGIYGLGLVSGNYDKVTMTGFADSSSSLGLPPYWWMLSNHSNMDDNTDFNFVLPAPQKIRIQVVDRFGLPISGAQISEILSQNINESITVTSVSGSNTAYLYNGGCNPAFGCAQPWELFSPSARATTGVDGYAAIIRFNTGPIGQLYLNLPGQGSNQPQTGLIINGSDLIGNVLQIPDRL